MAIEITSPCTSPMEVCSVQEAVDFNYKSVFMGTQNPDIRAVASAWEL